MYPKRREPAARNPGASAAGGGPIRPLRRKVRGSRLPVSRPASHCREATGVRSATVDANPRFPGAGPADGVGRLAPAGSAGWSPSSGTAAASQRSAGGEPPGLCRSMPRWLRASSPDTNHLLGVPCSLPRWIVAGTSRLVCAAPRAGHFPAPHWPSRTHLPVGIHGELFEVCSSFTHVTARRSAHPPYVGLVGRLRRRPFPDDAASQLLRHTDSS